MHPTHNAHPPRRLIGAVALSAALITGASLSTPTAHADVLPISPTTEEGRARWINPNLRATEQNPDVRIELLEAPTTITVGSPLTVALRVTNTTTDTITADQGLSILPKHGNAVTTATQARTALAQDLDTYPYFGRLIPLRDPANQEQASLAPGTSMDVSLTIPTAAGERGSLNIAQPGFYPIALGLHTINGTQTTQRFLLSVLTPDTLGPQANALVTSTATTSQEEQPGDAPADHNTPVNGRAALEQAATPLSIVVPITATVPIVPGETGDAPRREDLILSNDDLAAELAPGGRLAALVAQLSDTLGDNEPLQRATCLAIDPQLVDVLERMTHGYTVATQRPSSVSQKKRLRDSWVDSSDNIESTPGTGSADAADVLESLTKLAGSQCTVAVPWAYSDINAVAATGNNALMREAVLRGKQVLREVLGVEPVADVVVSPSGYVTEAAASLVSWAGYSSTVEETMRAARDPFGSGPEAKDASTVKVLVADSSLWGVDRVQGRFGALAPGVVGVGFDAGVAAALSDAASTPRTVGYGPYDARVDWALDSAQARAVTAHSALRVAVDGALGASEEGTLAPASPVLAMLPVSVSAASGVVSQVDVLSTAASLLESGQARPMGLSEYAALSDADAQALSVPSGEGSADPRFGAPYDDPTVVAQAEVLRVKQQAGFVDDLTQLMVNDPQLALTPYGFTAPLRHDLLRGLSYASRGAISTFDQTVAATDRLNGRNYETLLELKSSVSLLPPGNVYTRLSDSSPLLIVARNGLPLPVSADLRYAGPDSAQLSVPNPLIIPAKGSMTVNMTATLPEDPHRTDLNLWLATRGGAGISEPVDITVQTKGGVASLPVAVIGLVIALAAILLGRVAILRKRRRARTTPVDDASRVEGVAQTDALGEGRRKRRRWRKAPHRGGDKSSGDEQESR